MNIIKKTCFGFFGAALALSAAAFLAPLALHATDEDPGGLQQAANQVNQRGIVPCDGVGGRQVPVFDDQGNRIGTRTSVECNYNSLINGINTAVKYFLYISTFIAIAMLVWGGFQYLMAAGNPAKKTDAKRMIATVIVGILIVYSAWLIVYIILDKLLLNTDINNPLRDGAESAANIKTNV